MIDEIKREIYYRYLDGLRKSGVTNMYGAPAYLARVFGLRKDVALQVTADWMKSFSERHKGAGGK